MKIRLVSMMLTLMLVLAAFLGTQNEPLYPPLSVLLSTDQHHNPVALYEGAPDENLDDVQVPIPMKDRVFNKTGIQCVWCSFETLGRYANETRLYDLTEDSRYKSYGNPGSAAAMLNGHGVRFEQTYNRNDRHLLIKGCVQERRGVAFGVPGHMMVLVHYDEVKGIVKYINNSDKTLQIRTWTMEEFNRRWDGWAAIIYAADDIIPWKYGLNIPVVDKNNPQGVYQPNYILMPKRK